MDLITFHRDNIHHKLLSWLPKHSHRSVTEHYKERDLIFQGDASVEIPKNVLFKATLKPNETLHIQTYPLIW